MRALVTGADGFVGRHLVEHLQSSGDDVIASVCDVRDRQALLEEFRQARPEVMYHLAGRADVASSWEHPVETYRVNTEGTLNAVDAARLSNTQKVLAITSADIYGQVNPSDLPLGEAQPLRPVSPYAASKAAADMICLQAWLGHGLSVVRARSFNQVGPGQSDRFVVSAMAARVAECERIGTNSVRVGSLDARRDFVDVRDAVRAYRLLIQYGSGGEAYHVSSGVDRSIRDIAVALAKMSTVDLRLESDRDLFRPVDVPVLRGDNTKLCRKTGWKPRISMEQTLTDLLNHWRAIA